jgi:hypothetical protein
MAGGTGAGTTAVSVDAWDQILDSRFHHRHADLRVNALFGAIVLNECDFGHPAVQMPVFGKSNTA